MIVFISNFFNHHQKPLADQIFRLTSGEFRFIEQYPMPNSFKTSGYAELDNSTYVIRAWQNEIVANELLEEADVVLFGNIENYTPIIKRLNKGKLTFEVGERWLKKGWINIFSPRLIKSQWLYHTAFYNKPLYRLCASAYAANDMYAMRSFKGKCFKWGYFTEIRELDIDKIIENRNQTYKIRILSVARLISWKHHELSIYCANQLLRKGYDFELNIYGNGIKFEKIDRLIKSLRLENHVYLRGNISNDDILKEIRTHDIFLCTSDRNEGWGAVVNEAMSNACPVVGSDAVGSVPYLINDGENGLIFKSGDVNDLSNKVELLVLDKELRERMSRNAYNTMINVWSPENAARSFLNLIKSINSDKVEPPQDGPCSFAFPIHIN